MSHLVESAQAFATWAHLHQKRKYTGEPYITHPAAVVELVRTVPHTDEMLAAAWLHDVVEDNPVVELGHIVTFFGPDVAALVAALTDLSPSDGNRAARKAADRDRLGRSGPEAKTIKLADLIDNTKSIVQHDPGFAKVYLEEKRLLLEVLTEGDPTLYSMAWFGVESAIKS